MTTDTDPASIRSAHPTPLVFGAGTAIGILGGMIGLGGAEFRLPLLISLFGFAALSAVILNKAMSLVVVLVALPARLAAVSASEMASHWRVAVNLLAGSLSGAWVGASWAVRMRSATLYKVLAALMVLMATALLVTHTATLGTLEMSRWAQAPCGVAAGFGIGIVAAIMGVAGGELLIPTTGVPADHAGGLRPLQPRRKLRRPRRQPPLHPRHGRRPHRRGGGRRAAGGGLLLGVFPDLVLIPALAVILLVSAVKLAHHD